MAPKVAPKAKATVAACGLPPLSTARCDEQHSLPFLKRKRLWVKTAQLQPKCLQYLAKCRRNHYFKGVDAELVMDFLQHTDGATRDELLLRLLYHVHPRTVKDIVYLLGTAFKVFVHKVGEEGQEVEVTPESTVGEIKALQGLKGYCFYFEGTRWANKAKMTDLGVKAGENITAVKRRTTTAVAFKEK